MSEVAPSVVSGTQYGTAAARMLLALMKGEAPPSLCVDLGYKLIVRQST